MMILPPEPTLVGRFVGFYLHNNPFDVEVDPNPLDSEPWLYVEQRLIASTAKLERHQADTVKPPSSRKKPTVCRYSIIIGDEPIDQEVEADNYVAAAIKAAQDLFDRKCARRESGAAGGEGDFIAFDVSDETDGVLFTLRQM